MGFTQFYNGVNVLAVGGNQAGDEGKGAVTDGVSEAADYIIRCSGGANAGHTVVVNGKKRVYHLVPSGILRDGEGKINILGRGMVIHPQTLMGELRELEEGKLSYDGLRISKDAHVVMPYHLEADKSNVSQTNGGIGSTGRGIGPAYEDRVGRRGITFADYVNREVLAVKLKKLSERFPERKIALEKILQEAEEFTEKLGHLVTDTDDMARNALSSGRKLLLEGSQGLMLSLEHGTYPYVTSSDTSKDGMAMGAGIPANAIDRFIGVVKFPFMTRVGAGPFPSELGGNTSEDYCAKGFGDRTALVSELSVFDIPFKVVDNKVSYETNDPKIIRMINSDDPFIRGAGIRLAAGEYGATTGRPRRVGDVDAVFAKYAVRINGPFMVLTKPDCITGAESFGICYAYEKNGGESTSEFSRNEQFLRQVKPLVKRYPGWKEDISGVKNMRDLPESLRQSISDFERFTNGKILAVSVGEEREAIAF